MEETNVMKINIDKKKISSLGCEIGSEEKLSVQFSYTVMHIGKAYMYFHKLVEVTNLLGCEVFPETESPPIGTYLSSRSFSIKWQLVISLSSQKFLGCSIYI